MPLHELSALAYLDCTVIEHLQNLGCRCESCDMKLV